jgi:hypothetical protein
MTKLGVAIFGGVALAIFFCAPTGAIQYERNRAMNAFFQIAGQGNAWIWNGIAYSSLYPGATLDVRWNACNTAAATGAAASHICDARGEGGKQSILAQMNVGDASGDKVTFLLPAYCRWTASGFTGGTSSIIFQYSSTRIRGESGMVDQCEVTNSSADGGVYAFYSNYGPRGGYYDIEDLTLYSTSRRLAGPAVMYVPGGDDETHIRDMHVLNYVANQVGVEMTGVCCAISVDSLYVNANNTGGIPLDVDGKGGAGPITFYNTSLGHPAAGNPIFKCTGGSPVIVNFTGSFFEEIAEKNATVALNQVQGCGNVSVQTQTISATGGGPSTTAVPGWTISTTRTTSVTISAYQASHGFTVPGIAVTNLNLPAGAQNIPTDSYGNLTGYHTNYSFFDAVGLPTYTPKSTSACQAGTIVAIDPSYVYICVASGSVHRITHSSF